MADDDSKMVLGVGLNEADARELQAAVKELGEKIGSDLDRLAEGDDGKARQLQLDTKEAEDSLARVTEEFEQTGQTSEEAIARAEAALQKLGPAFGFKENLKLVAPEFEEISAASKEAGAAVERFGKLAETGGRGAERAAVLADQAIERLSAEIAKARASGGPVPPEWEKRLQGYREGLQRGTEAAGRFAASQKRVQDELAKSREKFASMEDQARTLPEAIIRKWPAAESAVVSFGAALATLQVSYRQTREFVGWVKEHFGVEIDAAMQEAIAATLDYTVIDLNRHKVAREQLEFEKNAANISAELRRREGETLEELVGRVDAYRNSVKQLLQEQEKSGKAQRAFIEAASGTTLEKLQERITNASEVVKAFGGDFKAISESGLFPEFSSEIDGIVRALDRYGAAFRLTLEGEALKKFDALLLAFQASVREKLVGTVQYAAEQTRLLLESFGIQTPEAIRKSTESLESLIDTLGGLGGVSREQAEKIAAEAQRILQAIALLPEGQREALADTTASLRATAEAYKEHAASIKSFSASGTEAVLKATEDRIAAWEREKAALSGLVEATGSARDELLKSLEPSGRQPSRGDRQTDPRDELQELKLKPIQSEEDLARIEELEDQLGSLREKQKAAAAGSDEVASAIARFREELASTGTVLTDLEQGAIKAFLSNLQQTADEGGATAAVIEDAFGAVKRTVDAASERTAQLNDSAAAAQETARKVATTAQALGTETQNIVASVNEAGEVLISNLADVEAGAEVVKATLDDATTAGAEWSKGTKESGAAVDTLIVGVDKLTAGMERVSVESARASEGLQGIEEQSQGAGEALQLITTHADEAAGPVARVADGLKAAASSAEPLHSSADAVHSMAQDAPGLADDLSRLEPAEKIQARAAARKEEAAQLLACAVAAERLAKALDPVKIKAEADALNKLADALARVAEGLEAERAAREGEEGAPN